MKRLDQYLVEKGLAKSRQQAQEKIKKGYVSVQTSQGAWILAEKSSMPFDELTMQVQIQNNPFDRYVSRAGLKLEGALEKLSLEVRGFEVLDVGASTGGFTDCLLQKSAKHIVALDVGHNQIDPALRNHPQVTVVEKLNARDEHSMKQLLQNQSFDLIVMDVSFISITLILPGLKKYLKPTGKILSLVKPQFELGPEALNKQGLVRDPSLYVNLEEKIREHVKDLGMVLGDYFPSSLPGSDGNQEFFVFICQQ